MIGQKIKVPGVTQKLFIRHVSSTETVLEPHIHEHLRIMARLLSTRIGKSIPDSKHKECVDDPTCKG